MKLKIGNGAGVVQTSSDHVLSLYHGALIWSNRSVQPSTLRLSTYARKIGNFGGVFLSIGCTQKYDFLNRMELSNLDFLFMLSVRNVSKSILLHWISQSRSRLKCCVVTLCDTRCDTVISSYMVRLLVEYRVLPCSIHIG